MAIAPALSSFPSWGAGGRKRPDISVVLGAVANVDGSLRPVEIEGVEGRSPLHQPIHQCITRQFQNPKITGCPWPWAVVATVAIFLVGHVLVAIGRHLPMLETRHRVFLRQESLQICRAESVGELKPLPAKGIHYRIEDVLTQRLQGWNRLFRVLGKRVDLVGIAAIGLGAGAKLLQRQISPQMPDRHSHLRPGYPNSDISTAEMQHQ